MAISQPGLGYTLVATEGILSGTSAAFDLATLVNVYVTDSTGNDVSVLSGFTIQPAIPLIGTGTIPFGIALTPNGARAYVTNFSSATVSSIDLTTNAVTTILLDVGMGPRGVTIVPEGDRAFVADTAGNAFTVINTTTDAISFSQGLPTRPNSLVATGSDVWITADGTPGRLYRYVRGSGTVDTAITTVGNSPEGVVVAPSGTALYVANRGSNTVGAYNIGGAKPALITNVNVGSNPRGVAITPDGAFVYATNFGGGTVSVIQTSDNTVVATVTVGGSPLGVAVTPDGQYAVVANSADNTVSLIRTSTRTVEKTVTVGSHPVFVGIRNEP
jgi:YVTN family beta-propeller protein